MQIASIWRYPVKSMLGERLDHATINHRGLVGDREYALGDARGKLGSGKSTNRFQAMDSLLRFSATYEHDRLWLTFPDGRQIGGGGSAADSALSEALGEPVNLVREGQISHFDAAPIHLITTASVRALFRRSYPVRRSRSTAFAPTS